jgi:hypothetical protein
MTRHLWKGAVVGLLATLVYMNFGDIRRYLKMSMM